MNDETEAILQKSKHLLGESMNWDSQYGENERVEREDRIRMLQEAKQKLQTLEEDYAKISESQ